METTRADRLRAFARMLAELNEVSVEEAGVEKVNQLDDLLAHARAGVPLHGHRLTLVDPVVDKRVGAAATAFAKATNDALERHRLGDLDGEGLQQAARDAFIQQGRRAFLAGKRALGNLSHISLQDERDIADQVDRAGLTPGVSGGDGSLGSVIERLVSAPSVDAQRIDDALRDYVAALVRNELRAGVGLDVLNQNAADAVDNPRLIHGPALLDLDKAEADQTDAAHKRIAETVSTVRRRYLAGTLTVAEAVATVMGAMEAEARSAYARGRVLRNESLNLLDQLGADDYESALNATEQQIITPLAADGMSLGQWYALLVAATALSDRKVFDWLAQRVRDMDGAFHALAQAGQKAAFRDGTPSPVPDDSTELPGAALAREQPSTLEENVVVWWNLDPEARHCIDCIRLSDMSPFDLSLLNTEGIYPGSGHTRCGWNCMCFLVFEQPQAALE